MQTLAIVAIIYSKTQHPTTTTVQTIYSHPIRTKTVITSSQAIIIGVTQIRTIFSHRQIIIIKMLSKIPTKIFFQATTTIILVITSLPIRIIQIRTIRTIRTISLLVQTITTINSRIISLLVRTTTPIILIIRIISSMVRITRIIIIFPDMAAILKIRSVEVTFFLYTENYIV